MFDNFNFKNKKNIILICVILLCISVVFIAQSRDKYRDVDFSQITRYLKHEKIRELSVNKDKNIIQAELTSGQKVETTYYEEDYSALSEKYILPQASEGVLKVHISKNSSIGGIFKFIPSLISILLIALILYIYSGRSTSSIKGKKFDIQDTGVTFDDVAGMEEEKKELEEIVDFLKNPEKYRNMGARIPKGVLLVGKPGTGKTYLSKAIAGEADVPFFSYSGSEFVELFVGLGASRVRSLFKQARKESPCIVFIDEIDAIGKKRDGSRVSSNDEKEGTLNQILVEMDGFDDSSGVIVLAATNRPDILDPALVRAGRFDRQVSINLPDINSRKEIFKIYCEDKLLSEDINDEILAKRTPGFTPADIENLMNEAAILAVRYGKDYIDMDIIEQAITKLIAGPEKKSRVINDDEKFLTAIHESGHAICNYYLDKLDPVHQINIIPHGYGLGGFTMTLPTEDRLYETKEEMTQTIVSLLGGRAAEFVILRDISTGASNDIQKATILASDMVTKYGFSESIGNISYEYSDNIFLGDNSTSRRYSDDTQVKIDSEIKEIIDNCYNTAINIVTKHKYELKVVANSLMDKEVLTGEEFEEILNKSVSRKKK